MAFDPTQAQPARRPSSGNFDPSKSSRARSPRVQAIETRAKFQKDQHDDTMQADRDENESSLGGIVHGTIEGLKELNPIDSTVDYLKDYGKGMATALEDADGTGSMDAITGIAAPILEYPAAMAYGAGDALLRSGDYGASRDEAFNFMNDKLPEGAKKAQAAVGSVLKPVGDLVHTAGKGVGELAALPFDEEGTQDAIRRNVGAATEDVLGFAGVKKVAPKGTPGVNPGPKPRKPVTQGNTADPAARARDAGYTIPASARTAEGKKISRIGSAAEGATGRTTNQHKVDQLNDQRVLKGIRKDLGLPENAAITEPAIQAIMKESGTIYEGVKKALPKLKETPALLEAVGGIGAKRRNNPYLGETPSVVKLRNRARNAGDVDTAQVLDAIQEFRDDARMLMESTEKPEAKQRAQASRQAADALENALDEALTQQGRADLIPSLKNARQRMAKAHQARAATSGKKRPGVALLDMDLGGEFLSGEMKLAADVQRDMSPNGVLHVDMASGAGNAPGDITSFLQSGIRPLVQPILNSERGQKFMFGDRQPNTLSPYDPQQFEVPPAMPTLMEQGDAFGGPLEFEPGSGRAGGQMPSDSRRLNSTIGDQIESQGPNADMIAPEGFAGGQMPSDGRRLGSTISDQIEAQGPNADLASQPGMPGRLQPSDERRLDRTTERQNAIRLEEFDLEAPDGRVGSVGDRRVSTEPYTGIEKRMENGAPDLSAERQRVLDRPIGTPPNKGIADEILSNPDIEQAVRGDSTRGRIANNPSEAAYGRMVGQERALAMQEIDSAIAENPRAYQLVGGRYAEIQRMTDPDAQLDALDALREDMIAAALMRER